MVNFAKSIDLCKLRPGDIIFTLYPAASSFGIAAATAGLHSHAMIVVYPDLWFETSGPGSGFKPVEDVRAYGPDQGPCVLIADTPYWRFDVLRSDNAPNSDVLLNSIAKHIVLDYPKALEFIPLFIGLRPFPNFAEKLVELLDRGKPKQSGSYCSQLVYKMLVESYGARFKTDNSHVSPRFLYSMLKNKLDFYPVDCRPIAIKAAEKQNEKLSNLHKKIQAPSTKLASIQYPNDKDVTTASFARTFMEMGISADPSKYELPIENIRSMLTRPDYFLAEKLFWSGRYT